MPDLEGNVKVTGGYCGNSVTKQHLSRHKSHCSGGTMYCPNSPNFFNKSIDDINFSIFNKHATTRVKNTHNCKNSFKESSGFYAMRQHKTSEHGNQMKSAVFDVNNLREDDDLPSKKNFKHVKISSLTLSLKKDENLVSISPCQPSTTL